MPALAARAATSAPSRVSAGLARAVVTGLSTSLGKEAQPVSHTTVKANPSAQSKRRKAEEEKRTSGRVVEAVGMVQTTVA